MTLESNSQDLAKAWDRSSQTYDRYVHDFTGKFAAEAMALALLTGKEKVLDVAAGTGALTLQMARHAQQVTAIDISPMMLKLLQTRLQQNNITNVVTKVMDGQALTIKEHSYDVVCSHFGIMLFEDRSQGFAEMYRVLRSGGRAIVTSPSTPEKFQPLGFFFKIIKELVSDLSSQNQLPPVFNLSDTNLLRSEMRSAGFQDLQIKSFVHVFEIATPEDYISTIQAAAPFTATIFERLGQEKAQKLHQAIANRLRERFGDQPVQLPGEVHIGIGIR